MNFFPYMGQILVLSVFLTVLPQISTREAQTADFKKLVAKKTRTKAKSQTRLPRRHLLSNKDGKIFKPT